MQTAFCEIVFYLNKQPHGHKLQTKMRSGLFSIHFTSQGEYANIVCVMWWWWWWRGGRGVFERGNWIKGSMRRDADYETETGRGGRRENSRRFPDKTG